MDVFAQQDVNRVSGQAVRVGVNRLFSDQTYHFQALRVLSDVNSGGADTAEVLEAIHNIPEGDASAWYDEFAALALRNARRAAACRDRVSAGLAWLRTHTYWRTAEFLLKPDDVRRDTAWGQQVSAFDSGLERLQITHERFDATYEGKPLRCIFYPGPKGWERRPLIVFGGGYDSTLEELYFVLVKAAYDRGYAVLTYEGPGQGAALREQGLTFIPDWERPVTAVLDSFLASRTPPPEIILVGMSMGGYLAPRAAAFDARIDGVVAYDVFFDMGAPARKFVELNKDPATKSIPGVVWAIDNAMWTLGLSTVEEVGSAFQAYELSSVAHRIGCHVLILAGEADHFVPLQQAKAFADACSAAKSVETVIYDRQSGGAEHCQLGAHTLWHETFFDWILRRFGVASF